MPPTLDPQLALDEKAVNAPELEAALERHLRAKDDVAEARGVMKTYRKEVDTELAKVGDFAVDTALRVGRFRITKTLIEARHVEFESSEREQIRIGLAEETSDVEPVRRAVRAADDDVDLRPTGDVNPDLLRGEAERASRPVGFSKPKGGDQPPVTH